MNGTRLVPRATIVGLAVTFSLLLAIPATSQWLNHPTPGIPRTLDGEPDLAAPAPRTADGKADFSGLWRPNAGGYQINATTDLLPIEIRPWAAAVTMQRIEDFGSGNPVALCLPPGPTVRAMMAMVKIVQTPNLIVMLYESGVLDRQVFMDARSLPQEPNPTWMGYSVAHWEGEVLVVESTGFNDKTWLDLTGHPHTEELRVTERFTRRDFGHMQLQLTVDDPQAYARPFTVPVDLELVADTELLEEVCDDRDAALTAGATLSAMTLSPSLLRTFTGTYEVVAGERFAIGTTFVVTLAGDRVMLQRPTDKIGLPLAPLSDNQFVLIGGGAHIEFTKGADGLVTQLVFNSVEGESRADRTSK